MPDPLPPAPLLSPKVLLAIGALALTKLLSSQVWGYFSGRPKGVVPEIDVGLSYEGATGLIGAGGGRVLVRGRQSGLRIDKDADDGACTAEAFGGSTVQLWQILSYGPDGASIGAQRWERPRACGFRSWALEVTTNGKVTTIERSTDGYSPPAVFTAQSHFLEFIDPIGETTDAALLNPLPVLPPLWVPPRIEPEPEVETQPEREVPRRKKPTIAPPLPPGEPVIQPTRKEPLTVPQPLVPGQPSTQPKDPAKTRPPVVVPRTPYRPTPPIPDGVDVIDGSLVPAKPKPTPVTPPDVVFPVPGGGPVGGLGQRPSPTLEGIAQETGRIEKKLEALMNPSSNNLGDKWDLLMKLIEAFFALNAGGSYLLTEPCDPDGDGELVTREVVYSGSLNAFGVLSNKLDALAELQQVAKDLRQPICRHPKPSGELVTVNFVSDAPSPQGTKPLRKFLRYQDQTNADLAVHGAHWRDFSWQAGPVCVCHKGGPWGVLQVWAVSADEGKRVIRHAGAVAGVDPDSQGEWLVTGSSDPRYGQPGTMRVERRVAGELRQDFLRVTKRSDPNGLPLLPAA